jgi:hypothetical protein
MSDLNEKYKKLLNQEPIIDTDQSLNKDLHNYEKKAAEVEIRKSEKAKIVEDSVIRVNLDYEYGEPLPYSEHSPSDKFKISKLNGMPEKPDKREKTVIELIFVRFLIVLIVAIIAFIVMFNRINSYVKPDVVFVEEDTTNTVPENITKTEKTQYNQLNITDQYYKNAIKISTLYFSDDKDGEKSEYIQIDGLRNETIEKNINDKLKQEADRLRKEIMNLNPNATDYFMQSYVTANFGNMISVRYQCYAVEPNNSNGVSGTLWHGGTNVITLSLVDGRELYLDDIFAPENINSILLGSSYNYFISDHTEMANDAEFRLIPSKSVGQVEEEQYAFVYSVTNNIKNQKISVLPNGVILFSKNGSVSNDLIINSDEDVNSGNYWKEIGIEFINFYDKIILFDKNREENLYDGKYMAIGPFELFTNSINVIEKNYQNGDNYHVDVSIVNESGIELPQEVQKTISTYVSEKISSLVKDAKELKKNFTAISGYVTVTHDTLKYNSETGSYEEDPKAQGKYDCFGSITVLVTTKERFKTVLYSQAMKIARNASNEGYGVRYFDNESKYSKNKYEDIELELDNLGNIIKEDGKEILPGIED